MPDRRVVLALALAADVDVRTARRALVDGVEQIKGVRLQENLRRGLAEINGSTAPASEPPHAA